MTTTRKVLAAIGAVALVVGGTLGGMAATSSGPFSPTLCSTCVTLPSSITPGISSGAPPVCSGPDVGIQITDFLDTLSAGTEVDFNPNSTSGLCYTVAADGDTVDQMGVHVPMLDNLTLNGQGILLYYDASVAPTPCTGSCVLPAVILVDGGHTRAGQITGLHIENFSLEGINPTGQYFGGLVDNAGIQLQGTVGTTISNVTATHVYGDCLDLEPARSHTGDDGAVSEVINLTVNGYTGDKCGRNGVSGVAISGATFTNVSLGVTGQSDAWDFEADSPGYGAQNVIVKNCTYDNLVNVAGNGHDEGPITMSNCIDGGPVQSDGAPQAENPAALRVSNTDGSPFNGRILFSNDHIRCQGSGDTTDNQCFEIGQSSPSGASADVQVHSSVVCIGNSTTSGLVYAVINQSTLDLVADTVVGYYPATYGRVGPNSTVTITGGNWNRGSYGAACTTIWPFP